MFNKKMKENKKKTSKKVLCNKQLKLKLTNFYKKILQL